MVIPYAYTRMEYTVRVRYKYAYGIEHSYKQILSKFIPLTACVWRNRVVAYVIAIRKNYSICVIYTHVNDGTCGAFDVV